MATLEQKRDSTVSGGGNTAAEGSAGNVSKDANTVTEGWQHCSRRETALYHRGGNKGAEERQHCIIGVATREQKRDSTVSEGWQNCSKRVTIL